MKSVFLFFLSLLFPFFLYANSDCEMVRSSVQEGDLIFIAIENELFQKVARSTLSWTSHVGVVVKKGDEWSVAESTLPVSRIVPLCRYIDKAYNNLWSVNRLADVNFTREQLDRLNKEVNTRLNVPYHLGFDFDSKTRQYCSKFVYEIYLNAFQTEAGKIEKIRDLVEKNPDPELISFWKKWFLGNIPMERRIVTPASQWEDSKFNKVMISKELEENLHQGM
ncbi:MAG: YiiX/YebB-like N1pC/P60 family cysteine hydrolase [Pseudobdellovibrionaceae bacterium]